jgi:hypothetical protein
MFKTRVILMIFVFGLVSIFSGVASGQSAKDLEEAFQKVDEAMKNNDFEKAEAILKPISEKGNSQATFGLGMMHQMLDSKKSLECLKSIISSDFLYCKVDELDLIERL